MSTQTDERPTYGNWITRKSAGVAGTGLAGTLVLLGGLVMALLALLVGGLLAAGVVAGVVVILFTMVGTPVGGLLSRRVAFSRQRSRREHQWRSGLFSRNRPPVTRLPGMLGRVELLAYNDPFGEPFAVVKNPRMGGLYTVVARCLSEGPALQDQERINAWVANFARVLESSAQEPALVCVKAITDTAPDPGDRLSQMVRSSRSADSPELSQVVMDEVTNQYPAASSENTTYLEFTFRGRELSRKDDEPAILAELARKVPGILGQLKDAGGGAVNMVSADELPAIVRVAYDPASQHYLQQAELAGEPAPVEWSEAGPVAYQESWGAFRHDSGVSVTWEMIGTPRSPIYENAFAAIYSPHRDFTRKRVALLMRPFPPNEATKAAENDAQTASFTSGSTAGKRVSATSSLQVRATEKTRDEVARGAALVGFSLLVTATMPDSEQMDQARTTINTRAGTVPIRLRRSYGSQAAGFAATLPIGFVPWEHTVIPDNVREHL